MKGFLIPAKDSEEIQMVSIEYEGSSEKEIHTHVGKLLGGIDFHETGRQVLLIRPTIRQEGLMAYYVYDNSDSVVNVPVKRTRAAALLPTPTKPENNKRATCFAMTCGLLNARFTGNVVVLAAKHATVHLKSCTTIDTISVDQLLLACLTPDIRPQFIAELAESETATPMPTDSTSSLISHAVYNNYHDKPVLNRFQRASMNRRVSEADTADYRSDDEVSGDFVSFVDSDTGDMDFLEDDDDESVGLGEEPANRSGSNDAEFVFDLFVARVPLCLQCRRPASMLCRKCNSAYFCVGKKCQEEGWSHECLCPTWKLYEQRRDVLSSVPLGPWVQELAERQMQLSNEPYEEFLNKLGIERSGGSWWKAEFGGTLGGTSEMAESIDLDQRRTYAEGLAPIADIPAESPVSMEALKAKNWDEELGLRRIQDWAEYYELRDIPISSPVALLLSFPLTLYHAIVEYGKVPCTVARFEKRALRIHVVGVEKELHFLPLFQETAFLLPDDLHLELCFVVRDDMLPESSKKYQKVGFDFGPKLKIRIVSGTYGETLDPRFDCGGETSSPPDMVMAFNAGLYAYESWRPAIEYLNKNRGVVGVFTDYNEWSGVQCASLGGDESRRSLTINPFRQPRAMPVYSMNLPQFSNGFLYVFNQQTPQD